KQISADLSRRVCRRDNVGSRRMRADFRAYSGNSVAQDLAEPVDRVGGASERAARQNEYRTGIEPVDLLRERFGKGLAEHDAFHLRKTINVVQHCYLSLLGGLFTPTPSLQASLAIFSR